MPTPRFARTKGGGRHLASRRVEQITFNKDTGIGKGIKSATMRVTGEDCYSLLKCESGVHK